MRFNSDEQAGLAKRATLRRVDLFVLTTYTDRDAKTVDRVWYWSDATRRYDYNHEGTVREFLPTVRSRTGPNAENMTHLQDFGGGHAVTVEVVLSNRPTGPDGVYLLEQVRDRLFRASVEIIEVAIPDSQDESDLTNLPGDRHTVVFRGEVNGIVKADQDTFTVQFTSVEPKVPWITATGTHVDPDDVGKRLPIVYGRMKRVEAVGIDVGAESTLSTAIDTASGATIRVSDPSRFHLGNLGNEVIIDAERFQIAPQETGPGVVNPIIGGVRQTGGVPGSATEFYSHAIGARVVELCASVYIVAGHPVKAIGDVFTKGSAGLVKIDPAKYTATPVDAGAGPNGETVATVRFTRAALVDLADEQEETRQTEVTQQPSVNQQTEITTLGEFSYGYGPGGGGGIVDIIDSDWNYQGDAASDDGGKTFANPTIDGLLDEDGVQSLPDTMTLHFQGFDGSVNDDGDEPITSNTDPSFDEAGKDIYVWFGEPGASGFPGHLKASGGSSNSFGPYDYTYTEEDNPDAKIYFIGYLGYGGSIPAFDLEVDLVELRERGIDPDTVKMEFARSDPPTHVFNSSVNPVLVAREVNVIISNTVTTDIEVAGDEASQVKVGGTPPRYGATKLKIYADVDGWTDDGLTTGTLLEDFPEIANHFIETVCGVEDGGDHSTDSAYAVSSLADLPHAMDMRALGVTFPPIISRLAWESRANVIRTEGQIIPATSPSELPAVIFDDEFTAFVTTTNGIEDTTATPVGVANAFTCALLFLPTSLPGTGGGWISAGDGIAGFRFGDGFSGRFLAEVIEDGGAPTLKSYYFDAPAGYTIEDGADELHLLTLTWDGTDMKLFYDGTELTPFSTPVDDAVTLPTIFGGIGVVGAVVDGPSYMFGAALWSSDMGAAEIGVVADLMRAGADLGTNFGSYTSSADLVQWFRPGVDPTDFAKGQSLTPDAPTGNGYLDADGDAVGDTIDTNTWDEVHLVAYWYGLSFLGDEDLTVSAVLEWGNAADMSDAAAINPAFLTGGVPGDFDFTLVDGGLDTGTGFVSLFYDPNAVGAKRYLRWRITVVGLDGAEFIQFRGFDRYARTGALPGEAGFVSNGVSLDDGGLDPSQDGGNYPNINTATAVDAPQVVPADPGNTFYRYEPASSIATKFRYGFPFMSGTSEDLLGALLDQYVAVAERPRDPETIKTRFRSLYAWDASRGGPNDANAFVQGIGAGPVDSAVTYPNPTQFANAEAKWGRRDEAPFLFLTIRNVLVAIDTLSYLAHTSLLDTRLWEFQGVPWEIAYALELADTVAVPEVPWAPNEAWVARVLGLARLPDTGMANLTLLATVRRGAFDGAGSIGVTGAAAATHAKGGAAAGLIEVTGAGVVRVRVTMTGAGSILPTGAGIAAENVRTVGAGTIGVTGSGVATWSV